MGKECPQCPAWDLRPYLHYYKISSLLSATSPPYFTQRHVFPFNFSNHLPSLPRYRAALSQQSRFFYVPALIISWPQSPVPQLLVRICWDSKKLQEQAQCADLCLSSALRRLDQQSPKTTIVPPPPVHMLTITTSEASRSRFRLQSKKLYL